jgi:phenylacetate-CoA ligase
VPYYNRIFKENRISPDDIKNVGDLTKIPVLTKHDIVKNRNELVSTAIEKGELIPSVSGGTGHQINFNVTRDQMSWELAAEFRGYEWAGYRLGNKCVNFWGSPIDTAKHSDLMKKVTSWVERMKVVNTYIISDEKMSEFASLLRSYKPEVVKGYASSVYMVAKYLKEQGINDIRPRTILTSAEMLLPHYREMIEGVFGCKVFDYYGSREIGALASQCDEHYGFHINAENVVMEFVRENEPVSDERGLIYVTNLRNYGMPFIRYEIGDVGKPSEESCHCGRGLPVIESLEGRASQFMAVYDENLGKIIPVSTAAPGIISNTLMQVPVESYRIYQESLEKIVIKVVAGEGYSLKDTDYIINHMQDYLGDRIKVEIDLVDDLPPLPSGKRSVFISKINAFQEKNKTS